MSDGFTKLSNNILTSSIWSESNNTRIMWITLLASCDAGGYVSGSIPGMAQMARLTIEETEAAFEILLAPDKHSRTKDYEGRRLMEVDGGWLLLNYAKYRAKRDPEKRKQQNKEAKRRQREREKGKCQQDVSQSQPMSAQAEAEAETTTMLSEKTFGEFWKLYPKKTKRKKALELWLKIPQVNFDKIMQAVAIQKQQEQWTKDNGKYAPNPASWLEGEQWNDEVTQVETEYSTRPSTEEEAEKLMEVVDANA